MPFRSRKKISIQGQFLCCRGQSTCYLALSLSISALCSPSKHPQPSSDCLGTRPLLPSLVCLYYPGGDNGNWPERAWARAVSPALSSTLSPVLQLLTGGVGVRAGPGKGALGLVHRHPTLPRQHPFSCPKFQSGWEVARPSSPRSGPTQALPGQRPGARLL